MSQADFLRQFDADAFTTFLGAGLGDVATYTAPGGLPLACQVLVDRDVRDFGEDMAPVGTLYTLVTFQRAQVLPVRGGVVTIGAESFELDAEARRDESISRWVVAVIHA